jgi:hypothetical protein
MIQRIILSGERRELGRAAEDSWLAIPAFFRPKTPWLQSRTRMRSFRPLALLWAALAQPVEHRIRNAGVACSSHAGGTISKARFDAGAF